MKKSSNRIISLTNYFVISSYIFVFGFLYIDIGSWFLKRFNLLQNKNFLMNLSVLVVAWLSFLIIYKNKKNYNSKNENQLSLYFYLTTIFILFEFTILKSVNFSILLYLLLLALLLIADGLNLINLQNFYKPNQLQLVIITFVFLCIDVNVPSDVLINTYSYTNLQRTGDIEQYLFLGNIVITDGFLIIYKIITNLIFLIFIFFSESIHKKLFKKLNYRILLIPILIVIFESLVTSITQNDYLHNSYIVNELVSTYIGKLPLNNYSTMYNNIFPYLIKFIFKELSITYISIFVSVMSVISIFLVLGIIKSSRNENSNNFLNYFIGLMIASTLLSRPHFSLRFLPVLIFLFVLTHLKIKNFIFSKLVLVTLISIATLNNFSFGIPLLISYLVCDIVFYYTDVTDFKNTLKSIFTTVVISVCLYLIYRYLFGINFVTYLTAPSLTYGGQFLEIINAKKFSFHYFIFPIIFYNLSIIFYKLRKDQTKKNFISLFINIYVIGLIPYYFNLQEIYHALPILMFTYLAIITNTEEISKKVITAFLLIGFLLLPRLFIGFGEIYRDFVNEELQVNFINQENYKNNYLATQINDLNYIKESENLNDNIGFMLNLNNLLQIYIDIENDLVENVPTSFTFNLLCNEIPDKKKYFINLDSAKYLKNYLNQNTCTNEIIFKELNSINNFVLIEIFSN